MVERPKSNQAQNLLIDPSSYRDGVIIWQKIHKPVNPAADMVDLCTESIRIFDAVEQMSNLVKGIPVEKTLSKDEIIEASGNAEVINLGMIYWTGKPIKKPFVTLPLQYREWGYRR